MRKRPSSAPWPPRRRATKPWPSPSTSRPPQLPRRRGSGIWRPWRATGSGTFCTGCDRSSAPRCHLNVALCHTRRESNKVWKNRLPGVKVGLDTLRCPETQRGRVMESMTKTCTDSNPDALEPALNDLKAYVQRVARQGVAVHEAEAGIWHRVLQLGHQALGE